MPIEKSSPCLEIFKKYISGKSILIVDPAASSRSGLFSMFQWMGAKTSQVVLASSFNQGDQLIPELKPHIVVAEYDLGNRCGLELLGKQRELRPDEVKKCLFIIATGNTTQSAVAQAMEEDIDAYVIKPLISANVSQTILRAAALKICPSEYRKSIERGKALLGEGKYDEAEASFQEAARLDPAPALAYYYQGLVDTMRKMFEPAQQDFNRGLDFNKIHYRCLIGLYDLYRTQGENRKAYEVARRIARFFPANPKRMEEILRLAIVTGSFDDVEEYYKLFISIEDRNESLIRHVCSALVVCGKYFLAHGRADRAHKLFEKAAISGVRQWRILLEIIASLVEYGEGNAAAKYMSRFSPESCESDEFLLSKFLVCSALKPSGETLMMGYSLLKKNLSDPRLYLVMCEKYYEAGKRECAEELANTLLQRFPDARAKVDGLRRRYAPSRSAS